MRNTKVTFLKQIYCPDVKTEVSLECFLDTVSKASNCVIQYRKTLDEFGKNNTVTKDKKKNLPSYVVMGTFLKSVQNNCFDQSSGIFAIDIDDLDKDTIATTKSKLAKNHHVIYTFISPSRDGIKCGLRVDPSVITSDGDFKSIYSVIEPWFADQGILIDPSCKDIRRICYLSYDPDIYINYDAKPINIETLRSESAQTTDTEGNHEHWCIGTANDEEKQQIASALNSLEPSMPYDNWLKIGMALHNAYDGSDEGLML